MTQYKPGQRVKIISLEKVRSYPRVMDGYQVKDLYWDEEMDRFAGTIREIKEISADGYYRLIDSDNWEFSHEMIEGPADPVEQEGQEEQEEIWREALGPDTELGEGCSLQHLLLRYTITRKNNPQ